MSRAAMLGGLLERKAVITTASIIHATKNKKITKEDLQATTLTGRHVECVGKYFDKIFDTNLTRSNRVENNRMIIL